jgi:hypothetical protein
LTKPGAGAAGAGAGFAEAAGFAGFGVGLGVLTGAGAGVGVASGTSNSGGLSSGGGVGSGSGGGGVGSGSGGGGSSGASGLPNFSTSSSTKSSGIIFSSSGFGNLSHHPPTAPAPLMMRESNKNQIKGPVSFFRKAAFLRSGVSGITNFEVRGELLGLRGYFAAPFAV